MLTSSRVAKLLGVRHMGLLVEDVPEPKVDEMLIKVEAAGVCGSDLHYFRHGGLGSFKQPLPMNMGHEPAGVVVDPNGHDEFQVGDRVAIEPGRPCLTSRWSLRGRHNLCKEGSFMGAQGEPGCFSDFVCVTPFQCCKMPPDLSFEAAALLEPVSVGMHTANMVGATFTDTVAIYGAGTIGLCCFLVLRRMGVQSIYMVDRVPFRRRFAVDRGATAAFAHEDAVKQLKACTGGLGCSLVIDTAGDDASLEACLQLAAVGARVALVAIPEADHLAYNPHQARTKEVRLVNVHRSNLLLREAMELFAEPSAAAQLDRLVTHRLTLDEVQQAFEMASGYTEGVLKIILQPRSPAPRRLDRVGLVGSGFHTSEAYLDRLLEVSGLEVCFVASLQAEGDSDAVTLQERCQSRGLRYLDRIDLCHDAQALEALNCDLVFMGDQPIPPKEVLARMARQGVVRTHLGLLPGAGARNPVMWNILRAQPQGANTHFVQPDSEPASASTIVDIFTCDGVPERCTTRTVRDLLIGEVIERLPRWITSLRSGIFDMSAMRAFRLGRRQRAPVEDSHLAPSTTASAGTAPFDDVGRAPNDSFISWSWRCAFIVRYSDALDQIRTRLKDGVDVWFSVETASCVQLDALPAPGVILSVAADGSRFVVRASDGLVTCRRTSACEGLQAGASLESVCRQDRHFCIPVDFAGATFSQSDGADAASTPPPPPPPIPGVTREPRKLKGEATPALQPFSTPDQAQSQQGGAEVARTNIPIYDLHFEEGFVQEFKEKAADVLTSGRPLSENKFCRAFEAEFSQLVQAPFAVVANSGTMALTIAMKAIGVKGKAVITPSNTFFATQVAVENAGGRVIFADCEPDFMQLCPRGLETLLAAQPAGSVAAVVLVHVGGIVAPFAGELRTIAHRYGAKLVEDAAHAHTSHLDGVGWAGTIGDIAAFSFFATKVMTMGEGGMITTRDEALHKACTEIKLFGADLSLGGASRLTCGRPDGANGRVPELSALMGLLDCARVLGRVRQRQALVAEYVRGLAGCPAYTVLQQPGGSCSYYKCIVKLQGIDREFLRNFAKERGISFTGEVYHLGVHRMPAFMDDHHESLPTTDAVCRCHACPPLYPELTLSDIRHICQVMRDAAVASGVPAT